MILAGQDNRFAMKEDRPGFRLYPQPAKDALFAGVRSLIGNRSREHAGGTAQEGFDSSRQPLSHHSFMIIAILSPTAGIF